MDGLRVSLAAALTLGAVFCGAGGVSAQTAPSLGAAQSFAILGSTVTNTGPSVIAGDVGSSPGTSITGFPPGIVVSGTIHAADAAANSAQGALTTAYNNLAGQTCTEDLSGQDLGGKTLTPGVYCFSTSAQLTGTLTLNTQGNPAAVFIFKIGSTLTTASGSSVALSNALSECIVGNVFWQIGSSATLGTGTRFSGNIVALTSVTLTTGARVAGRVLARNGSVSLDSNPVTIPCAAAVCPAITLSPSTLPNGREGVAYLQTITGNGGVAPYTFAVTGGALPGGMTLSAAGVLTGTPTAAGTFTFTVRATDANGCVGTATYSLVVAAGPVTPPVCPAITLTPATLPNGTLRTVYSQTITGNGGTAPYTFGLTGGALPAGLTLASTGVIAGTPTTTATNSFTIRGTDANGCFATAAYAIVVVTDAQPPGCAAITISPPPPNGTVGVAYTHTMNGSGGTAPYTFGVTGGTLPAGLTLTPAGVLAGMPTSAGTASFTIRATDANGCFVEIALSMSITTAVPTLPQTFVLLLTLGLAGAGYLRLRQRGCAA
jgi:hypothetical protein